jgi:uncharacterized repeat protein (TIGR01451 family)
VQDPPAPVVAIRVRVPAEVKAGQDLEYKITVENTSQAAAHHVLVRNPVPANARFVRANPEPTSRAPDLLWQLNTLEAGAKREITLMLSPTSGDEVKSCARVQFEHGECVRTRIARPALRMQKEGPKQALLYDALHYKLILTNTGRADLTNLLLTDILPKGLEHASGKERLSWILGTLAPGQSRSVEYQVIAKATGRLCNKAVAVADGNFRQEMESCVEVKEAKLDLGVTGPRKRYLTTPAAYQIRVSNPGSAALTHVLLTIPLPPRTSLVSASQGNQVKDRQLQWSLGTLEPGKSPSLDLILQAQSIGQLCFKATATADRGLSKEVEFCTDFAGVPALALEVEKSEDPVEIGAANAYTITVRNPGTKPAEEVKIVASVPPQMEITQTSGPAEKHQIGQQIAFDALTLDAGGEARYRIDVKALRAGDVRFKVELTAKPLTAGPVQQEESTTIYLGQPSSRIKKKK